MRIPRPWLAVAFRRHEGLGLLGCGPLVRTRLGKRAGVRPRFVSGSSALGISAPQEQLVSRRKFNVTRQ